MNTIENRKHLRILIFYYNIVLESIFVVAVASETKISSRWIVESPCLFYTKHIKIAGIFIRRRDMGVKGGKKQKIVHIGCFVFIVGLLTDK